MSKQPQLSLENYQALELNSSDLFSEIQLREFLKTLLTKNVTPLQKRNEL